MDLPYGDETTRKFVTNVGIVCTKAERYNIMACEWTHHVSYSPGLIAVCVNPKHATHSNIEKSKEFGISICASDQSILSSIAGGYGGKRFDKIEALKELGFGFLPANKIDVMLVKEASLNVECTLHRQITLGDHTMFVGEIIHAHPIGKEPLAFHSGKYWSLQSSIPKPSQKEIDRINQIIDKHRI